jgi:predicted heme/steroid binding protein
MASGEKIMKLRKLLIALSLISILALGACSSASSTKVFTIAELAKYNGQNGNKAYVAVNGKVYDVSNVSGFGSGSHQGVPAGIDATSFIAMSPHGSSVLQNLKVVGTLQ